MSLIEETSFVDDDTSNDKKAVRVTRFNWAIHTSLSGLDKMFDAPVDDCFIRKELSERCYDGMYSHNNEFEQFHTGLCCITKVESMDGSSTISSRIELDKLLGSRYSEVIERKIQYNGYLFSNEDRIPYSKYINVKDEKDVINLGEDYQDRGIDSVPEEVLFYYLNFHFLGSVISSLKNSKSKDVYLEVDNHGTLTKDITVTISYGPIMWVEYPHKFRFKRFIITLIYKKISESKVGCTVHLEDDRGLETEVLDEKALEEEKANQSELDVQNEISNQLEMLERAFSTSSYVMDESRNSEDELSKG